MKKFSEVQPINKKTLAKVPDDEPGVCRIIDRRGKILLIGKVLGGGLSKYIENHQGRPRIGTHFQYMMTSSKKDAERLMDQEIINTPMYHMERK